MPEDYNGHVSCDGCGEIKLEDKENYYHCSTCSYDLCNNCSNGILPEKQIVDQDLNSINTVDEKFILCRKNHLMERTNVRPKNYDSSSPKCFACKKRKLE